MTYTVPSFKMTTSVMMAEATTIITTAAEVTARTTTNISTDDGKEEDVVFLTRILKEAKIGVATLLKTVEFDM